MFGPGVSTIRGRRAGRPGTWSAPAKRPRRGLYRLSLRGIPFGGSDYPRPDLHLTLGDILAEGDRVAFRYTMEGTHQGDFVGIPPTGKPFSVEGMIIARVVDSKAVERWANLDTLGLMQQLGVIPSPEQAQA